MIQVSDMSYNPDPQAVTPTVVAATLNVLKDAVLDLMAGNESGDETVDVGKCNDMFFVGNELTFSPLRYLEPCVCQSSLGP